MSKAQLNLSLLGELEKDDNELVLRIREFEGLPTAHGP